MKHKHLVCFLLLFSATHPITAQVTTDQQLTRADTFAFNKSETEYQQVQMELQQLEQQKKQLLAMMNMFNEQQKKMIPQVEKLETTYNALSASNTTNPDILQEQVVNATKQFQETQMSFNLQFLQLQSQMQHENRSYTAISNIMKIKHDTVKNSITNIR